MVHEATKRAAAFLRSYYSELGALAPDKFSREEQHALLVLAAYIREQDLGK